MPKRSAQLQLQEWSHSPRSPYPGLQKCDADHVLPLFSVAKRRCGCAGPGAPFPEAGQQRDGSASAEARGLWWPLWGRSISCDPLDRAGGQGEVTQPAAVTRTADGVPAGLVTLTREAQIVLAGKAMSNNLFTSTYPGFQSAERLKTL